MYYYLTGALKRKVIRELKICFRYFFDQHKDILPHINHKYSFKERPQKGIIVTGVGAAPNKLSADNFVGTVISHVMHAQVDNHKGHSIEWVREDLNRVKANEGYFPSEPGIYYIEVRSSEELEKEADSYFAPTYLNFSDMEDAVGKSPYYFYVDPLLTVTREPVLKVSGPQDTEAFVMNTPALEGTIRLFEDGDKPLMTGHYLRLQATNSLEIKSSSTTNFGMKEGHVPCTITGTEVEPFQIDQGQNDSLMLTINGIMAPITLQTGLRSSEEVAADIRNALYGVVTSQDFKITTTPNGKLKIETTKSLTIEEDTGNDGFANNTLGLQEGDIPVTLEGHLFHSNIVEDSEFSLVVNGNPYTIPFYRGDNTPSQIAERIEEKTSGLISEAVEGGDFTFDHQTGKITLIKPFSVGTEISASYKYPVDSKGPYPIRADHSNNNAIPGVVMAFGRRISEGDKSAIVVHPNRVAVADEYGGRWDMSVDLDIITRDPSTREEISDMILMYFFGIRKSSLTEEGIELTDISFGGESEDVYDKTSDDFYFNSSISLSFQTDWAIHVPKPLTIERVTPVSFEEEAKAAGLLEEELPPDLLKMLGPDALNLKRMRGLSLKGKNRDFEDIK